MDNLGWGTLNQQQGGGFCDYKRSLVLWLARNSNRNTLLCRFEKVEWFEAQEKPLNITTVTCGSWHTGAVDKDQNLYRWGRGDVGQIGNGQVRAVHYQVEYGFHALTARIISTLFFLMQCQHQTLPTWLERFTVAHPGNTLHRTNRPKPKLRPRETKAEAPQKLHRQVYISLFTRICTESSLSSVIYICQLQVTCSASRRRPQPSKVLQQIPPNQENENIAHETHQRSFSAPARDNKPTTSSADAFAGGSHACNSGPCPSQRRTHAQRSSIARSHSASAVRSTRAAGRVPMTRLQHALRELTDDPALLASHDMGSKRCSGTSQVPCSFPLETGHAGAMPAHLQEDAQIRPSRPVDASYAYNPHGPEEPVTNLTYRPQTRSQARSHRQDQEGQHNGLLVAERTMHAHAGPCMPLSHPCVNTGGLACEDEACMPASMDIDSAGCSATCNAQYRNSSSIGSAKKQRTQAVQKKLLVGRRRPSQGKASAVRGKTSSHPLRDSQGSR